MLQTQYLIIGSSHAALSSVEAIRLQDKEGSIIMVTREKTLPYSPTILPYIVSGDTEPDRAYLRDDEYFSGKNIIFMKGTEVTGIDTSSSKVIVDSGEEIQYGKLLIATGASPSVPPVEGLDGAAFHVLRTLDDALKIRSAVHKSNSAVILGAGLIGMHAAENLKKAGMEVSVVEMLPQVLPGYFDGQAAGMIQKAFSENEVRVFTGNAVTHVTPSNNNNKVCVISLENGLDLSADLLVVATGVRPNVQFINGSGIEVDKGIIVDDTMRTNVDNVWAAGDVAQARSFFESEKILNGILPDAVEQGWIAGLDMVNDSALKPYKGAIPMNTYRFFGNRSFSVGVSAPVETDGEFEVDIMYYPSSGCYQKFVFKDDLLVGASAINADLDPGIILHIIRNQIYLGEVKGEFAGQPKSIGRSLMSTLWR